MRLAKALHDSKKELPPGDKSGVEVYEDPEKPERSRQPNVIRGMRSFRFLSAFVRTLALNNSALNERCLV